MSYVMVGCILFVILMTVAHRQAREIALKYASETRRVSYKESYRGKFVEVYCIGIFISGVAGLLWPLVVALAGLLLVTWTSVQIMDRLVAVRGEK